MRRIVVLKMQNGIVYDVCKNFADDLNAEIVISSSETEGGWVSPEERIFVKSPQFDPMLTEFYSGTTD